MDFEVRLVRDRVLVQERGRTVREMTLEALISVLAGAVDRPPNALVPGGVRLWCQRRDAVACAIEVPPHARSVRWLSPRSRVPFGPGAHYERRYLAFPYVVVLVVLRGGELTGLQQLYYRRAPLEQGEDLLLPNLPNVAEGYGMRCWLCLNQLGAIAPLPWAKKVEAIGEHVFAAAFNRSSEVHEGNSYWGSKTAVEARVATLEAWETASRENGWFALDVPWRPAGTTVSAELRRMLDAVVAPLDVRTATDVVGLIQAVPAEGGAQCSFPWS